MDQRVCTASYILAEATFARSIPAPRLEMLVVVPTHEAALTAFTACAAVVTQFLEGILVWPRVTLDKARASVASVRFFYWLKAGRQLSIRR
jgi:hypothetical protein